MHRTKHGRDDDAGCRGRSAGHKIRLLARGLLPLLFQGASGSGGDREGDTKLMMKALTPVRLLKNDFADRVAKLEGSGASKEELLELLGTGRSMRGMFLGDLEDGELEIGQVSALIHDILPAATIVSNIWNEFEDALAMPIRRY